MNEPLDLDSLAELIVCADPTAPLDHLAVNGVLRDAAPALIAMARRAQQDASRLRTHAPDCHLWGPRHYDCLMREYDASRAEIARFREALEAAEPMADKYLGYAERNLDEPEQTIAHDALAKVRAALGNDTPTNAIPAAPPP